MQSRSAAACAILTLLSLFGLALSKQYSTNAICQQYNCINPIFPGLEDLRRLEATQMQCQPNTAAKQYMKFCKNAVFYDVAMPSPKQAMNLSSVVMMQDDAASTAYFYHLSGMNVDSWEHKHPDRSGNPCAQAVWKMVCNTYFPRAEAGCKKGEVTKFLRPCKNACTNYIQACDVQCCDESVQCVFDKKVALLDGKEATISGYHDALGPSAACTGAATRCSAPGLAAFLAVAFALLSGSSGERAPAAAKPRSTGASSGWLARCVLCLALVVVSTSLQGCMLGQAWSHPTPAWKDMQSYWKQFQYIAPGAPARDVVYNSCTLNIPKREQCNGNGECRPWRADLASAFGKPYEFCQCYRDWADPECRTKRKSQMTAYFISVFAGFLGCDQYYLGFYYTGFAKFATLGGLGVWWVIDIVRIGSSPVYASEYRLAYDLPHWLYVAFTIFFFTALGYFFYALVLKAYKREKNSKKMLLQAERNLHKMKGAADHIRPEDVCGNPSFASYPLPLPAHMMEGFSYGGQQYGAVPKEVKFGGQDSAYSPWAVWNHAMKGFTSTSKYDARLRPRDASEFAQLAKPQMPRYGYGY